MNAKYLSETPFPAIELSALLGVAMRNVGSYFEIPVTNLERAIEFYSAIFECEFERDSIHGNEMAFFPFRDGEPGIAGALAKGEIYKPSILGTLVYLSTLDVELTLTKILERGGELLFPKTEVPNYGWVAEFKDCEGNRVALFQKK